jgi:transaldolase / glucose-6-phosphate isomerase
MTFSPRAAAALRVRMTPGQTAATGAFARAWIAAAGSARLARRDASLWSATDEARWLGWLDAPRTHLSATPMLEAFAAEVRAGGFTDALLLGMGGSSMCPEVLAATRAPTAGLPRLHVLDSIDPAQIRHIESMLNPARTLLLIASKSGGTLEPNLLAAYFLERLRAVNGPTAPARQCVAITDPGSSLERFAIEQGFWRIFHGVPEIGGRYSALSHFGLVPAALLGVPVAAWLRCAERMTSACSAPDPVDNPGVALGLVIGALARGGRDKLTLVSEPALAPLEPWIEQLVAESLGKHGKGVLPVLGESLDAPERYADDRVFVHITQEVPAASTVDPALGALAQAGHPVITVVVAAEPNALAAEFVRWATATAVAGHVLRLNPFDQPDVESAKIATRALADAYEASGELPSEQAIAVTDDFSLYAVPGMALPANAQQALSVFFAAASAREPICLLAFIEMSESHRAALAAIRACVRDRANATTTIGFGPRYLHSTGQYHKGGPDGGLFVIFTCDEAHDLAVPGRRATFGVAKLAQARGDFQALAARGRRVLRVHLRADVALGLARFEEALQRAL